VPRLRVIVSKLQVPPWGFLGRRAYVGQDRWRLRGSIV
jgi:hypothetical protein